MGAKIPAKGWLTSEECLLLPARMPIALAARALHLGENKARRQAARRLAGETTDVFPVPVERDGRAFFVLLADLLAYLKIANPYAPAGPTAQQVQHGRPRAVA